MADEAVRVTKIYDEPGQRGSAAEFLANRSNSGRALHPLIVGGHGKFGDGQAVADKATAPKIYGEPGQCGSAAGFFMDVSNSDNFNCSLPTQQSSGYGDQRGTETTTTTTATMGGREGRRGGGGAR